MLAYGALVTRTGWLVEDAYITFRVVDNLLEGYGPRWNTVERVQAFTHPLWMLVVTLASGLTREFFFTTIFLQVAISVAALAAIVFGICRGLASVLLVTVAAMLSKSFVDWSTGGLENPLSHLLAALACVAFLRGDLEPSKRRRLLWLSLLTSLAMVNRLDAGIVLMPAVGILAIQVAREGGGRSGVLGALRVLVLGSIPLLAWETFSFLYYGSLVPNTAYAKLSMGLPHAALVAQGLDYLRDSIRLDPLTLGLCLMAPVLALATRRHGWALAVGVALQLAYVVNIGGDYMSGRFLSLPFLVALALLADLDPGPARGFLRRSVVFVIPLCVVLFLARRATFPTLSDRYWASAPVTNEHGIGDYYRGSIPNSSLRAMTRDKHLPDHPWIQLGVQVRNAWAKDKKPPIWGGVGYAGFYAGPEVFIIDKLALTDPLLARLPMPDAAHTTMWRIGHFERAVPEGYVESVVAGRNLLASPDLARYYDDLSLATRGPIFGARRLGAVLRLNLGLDDGLLRRYLREYDWKPVNLTDLPPARPRNPAGSATSLYTWWGPAVARGVAFTSAGLLVKLQQVRRSGALAIEGSRGRYELEMRLGRRDVGHVLVDLSSKRETLTLPAEAVAEGYDAVVVTPEARGIVQLTYLELLP